MAVPQSGPGAGGYGSRPPNVPQPPGPVPMPPPGQHPPGVPGYPQGAYPPPPYPQPQTPGGYPQMPGMPPSANMPGGPGYPPVGGGHAPQYGAPPAYSQPPGTPAGGAPQNYGGGVMFPTMPTPANAPPGVRSTNLPPAGARPQPIPSPTGAAPPVPGPPRSGNVPPAAPRPVPAPQPVPSPQPVPQPPGGQRSNVPPSSNVPRTTPGAGPAPVPRPVPAPIPAPPPNLKPMSLPGGAGGPPPIPLSTAASDEEDAGPDVAEVVRRNSIPLGVSFVVHLLLIVILGLLSLDTSIRRGITLQASLRNDPGENELADLRSFEAAEVQPLQMETEVQVFTPQPTVAVNVPVSPFGTGRVTFDAANVSSPAALAARGMKGRMLGERGGGQDTEDAVSMALTWLARRQQTSGLWSLTGTDGDAKSRYSKGSMYENHEAATAMALLAFLGAGYTHKSDNEYGKTVAKAMQALLRLQDASGNFFRGQRADDALYSQAQCTMAMCELYALTRDEALKEPCERAVKYIVEAQDQDPIKGGGWRYRPRSDSDTSVTGWMVMALQSAKYADIAVPQQTLDRIMSYLDKAAAGPNMINPMTTVVTIDTPGVTKPQNIGSKYAYQPGMDYDRVMTAEGLLCRMYLGWPHDDPRLVHGCELLLDHLPQWKDRDVYFWYYGTQTMFHMEGRFWNQWNDALKGMLVTRQEKTGPERGSWDPLDNEGPDLWSLNRHGGRLYVTCFSVYMLEVYYRHLPLFSELKKQIEAQQQKRKASQASG